MNRALVIAMLALAGCSKDPPPAVGLKPAPAELRADCGDLIEIPAQDGDKAVRAAYYAATRDQFAACRDRHRGLKKYAETVSPPKRD